MNKLDWYIIKKFLGTFFFSIILMLLIVVVFDVSEKIDDFIEKEAPLKSIIFDNLITNKYDFQNFWEIPIEESWYNRFF